jgi:hypothetical protein
MFCVVRWDTLMVVNSVLFVGNAVSNFEIFSAFCWMVVEYPRSKADESFFLTSERRRIFIDVMKPCS